MCGHDLRQKAYHSRRPPCKRLQAPALKAPSEAPSKHPLHFLLLLSRKRQLGRTGAARRVAPKDLDDVRSNGKLAADLGAQRVTTAPPRFYPNFSGEVCFVNGVSNARPSLLSKSRAILSVGDGQSGKNAIRARNRIVRHGQSR